VLIFGKERNVGVLFMLILGVFILMFAAFLTTANAQDNTVRVCSGGEKGNYYWSVNAIAQQAKGALSIENIATKGSWDNLDKLAKGECDAAIVQADAWGVWNKDKGALNLDRVDSLYNEYVHMFCNRELGFDSVTDLSGRKDLTIAIGENGSGTAVTWRAMGLEDDGYNNTNGPKTVPFGGTVALTKVKDGTDVDCALFVSGLNSSAMGEVAKQAEFVQLINFDDYDFNDAVDPKGKQLYEFVEIPGDTYGELQEYTGILGGGDDIETIALKATLVVRTSWMEQNQDAYSKFVEYQLNAQPVIRDHVKPKY
jgi:TRAP transporter TAXI family solute receptor